MTNSRLPMAAAITAAAVALLAVVALAVVAVTTWMRPDDPAPAAAPSTSPPPATLAISGSVRVIDPDMDVSGSTCRGEGGYEDIRGGVDVMVKDPSGAKVAVGKLDAGKPDGKGCMFAFTVTGVPVGPQFYTLHIGNRSPVNVEAAKIRTSRIDLTLGDD